MLEIATAQDVGRAMNPQAVVGQIHGRTAQCLGLALMEELQLVDGKLCNPSFTDYLLPTILDMPPMQVGRPGTRRSLRPIRCARSG
jgi:CO/xanthine dehydrogenase Mo-binding subunit